MAFIKHGSRLVRVPKCRLVLVNPHNEGRNIKLSNAQDNKLKDNTDHQKHESLNDTVEENPSDKDSSFELKDQCNLQISNDQEHIAQESGEQRQQTSNVDVVCNQELINKVKVNDRIWIRENDQGTWTNVKILGKGGKSTGRNRFYYNVENESQEKFGVFLDQVQFEIIAENSISDDTHEEVNVVFIPAYRHHEAEVIQAKQVELQNWKDMEVYEEIKDQGQKVISTRWVITEKICEGQKGAKARLVARGFEDEDQVPSDSPTGAKSTLRTVLAITANEGWIIETTDIKAAFLQSRTINRNVYILPPPEARQDGILWKLKKTVYGLDDASREWYFSVKDLLLKNDCKQSSLDKALFRWYNKKGQLEGLIVLHVDDFLLAGSDNFAVLVTKKIEDAFRIGKRKVTNFRYVGLDIEQTAEGIIVRQEHYIDEVEEIMLFDKRNRNSDESLSTEESRKLKKVAGQLSWVASQTRPDLSFDALELNIMKNILTVEQVSRANKAIRMLKRSKTVLVYPRLGSFNQFQLKVFSDASWGNLPDKVSSARGHLVFLSVGENVCPLPWISNKVRRKVSSTLSAETLALNDALDDAVISNTLFLKFIMTMLEKAKYQFLHI